MLAVWTEIFAIPAADGITFDGEELRASPIREDMEYVGVRLRTTATIARARIFVTVDISFGDTVEPGPEEIDLPVLLDLPAPHLRAYARETVIAEKFRAMVTLGRAVCSPHVEVDLACIYIFSVQCHVITLDGRVRMRAAIADRFPAVVTCANSGSSISTACLAHWTRPWRQTSEAQER